MPISRAARRSNLTADRSFRPIGQLPYLLTLSPYGFYWFALATQTDWPTQHTPAPELMPDYQTFVIRKCLADALIGARAMLEREVLPTYLSKRRWFAMKDQSLIGVGLALITQLTEQDLLLAEVEIDTPVGTSRWLLPLGIAGEDHLSGPLPAQLALASVRRGARVGLLTDGFALAEFALAIMTGLAKARTIPSGGGEVRFLPTHAMQDVTVEPNAEMQWLSADQSNSSVIIGSVAMLKLFRRIVAGPHPEAEMGRYLTEQGFANAAPLLGEVVRVAEDGASHALAIAQGFIRNQGDAFTWSLDLLMRGLSDLVGGDEAATTEAGIHEDYNAFAYILGRRVGELHAALAKPTDNPDFAPEAANEALARQWAQQARLQLDAAFEALATHQEWSESGTRDLATVLMRREPLNALVDRLAACGRNGMLTRVHGDLHLGQVLVANGDAYIIDFEGEPAKPLDARRAKNSRLRDVAGMLRSFDYAAAVVERKSSESHAHIPETRRSIFLRSFIEQASSAFLAGYREAMEIVDIEAEQALLDLFLVEKAAYEITYEAANRPAWIEVPLHGLVRLCDSLLEGVGD